MSNPFNRKFTQFAATQSAKNAHDHSQAIVKKSGEVFEDKPFSIEYRGIYRVSVIGQSVSQIVTYLTTAALGVFALVHVIPLAWGIYVAVPLALLFAFGVEKVKRSTLAIAAKHFLKYRTFGAVGLVAILTLCVSIAAALYGARELPGVVYGKPGRAVDTTAVAALSADINRLQSDIDRLQSGLKSGKNWVAENRTLPKLQQQRAALVERRDAANGAAEWRAQAQHNDAVIDREDKVAKMQTYSVGAAIVAELIFLLCTLFVFYYLFRSYVEANERPTEQIGQPVEQRATVGTRSTGTANLTIDENRLTKIVADVPGTTKNRVCAHCQLPYIYAHAKQKYCSDQCRVEAWEERTGAKLKRNI